MEVYVCFSPAPYNNLNGCQEKAWETAREHLQNITLAHFCCMFWQCRTDAISGLLISSSHFSTRTVTSIEN